MQSTGHSSRQARSITSMHASVMTYATSPPADPEPLCEQLTVLERVAEQQLRAPRPPHVQVRLMLPGDDNPAIQVDVLTGSEDVRFGGDPGREPGRDRELIGRPPRRPEPVVGSGSRARDRDEDVSAA